MISATVASAQGDTLLYENFDVDNTAGYALFNGGNDTTWVNYDADGLLDANGRPQNWFWSSGAFATPDTADACLFSSSWLDQFLPGNRNWLMTPPITIVDANAVLSWASAPRQTPRYLDGYTVLVSTTDNIESSFTDTLFQAAQNTDASNGVGYDFSTYAFSPGFIHGLDSTFVEYDAAADSGAFLGVMRPFSATLAPYSGQTIYIAFLHDADDDNLIALDDILITGTLVGVNENASELGLTVFPNPASDKIELNYLLKSSGSVSAKIYDVKGSVVMNMNKGIQIAGNQKLAIDISKLATGSYTIELTAAGTSVSSKFVKE